MASSNRRKASGSRTRTASSHAVKATRASQARRGPSSNMGGFGMEVLLWVVVAASILLFISNFGVGGVVGNAVSRFFFGMFGLLEYVFPILLIIGVFFGVSNRGSQVAAVKIVAICLLVLFLCLLFQLIASGKDTMKVIAAYSFGHENKRGGGLFGGILAAVLCKAFGLAGSYVIDVAVLIIAVVMLTGRSAMRLVQNGSRRVYESARDGNARYREHAQVRSAERAEERARERELRDAEWARRREEAERLAEERAAREAEADDIAWEDAQDRPVRMGAESGGYAEAAGQGDGAGAAGNDGYAAAAQTGPADGGRGIEAFPQGARWKWHHAAQDAARRRMEKKAVGVAVDTKIANNRGDAYSDEVSELRPEDIGRKAITRPSAEEAVTAWPNARTAAPGMAADMPEVREENRVTLTSGASGQEEAAKDGKVSDDGGMPLFSPEALSSLERMIEREAAEPSGDGGADGAYGTSRTAGAEDASETETVATCLAGSANRYDDYVPQPIKEESAGVAVADSVVTQVTTASTVQETMSGGYNQVDNIAYNPQVADSAADRIESASAAKASATEAATISSGVDSANIDSATATAAKSPATAVAGVASAPVASSLTSSARASSTAKSSSADPDVTAAEVEAEIEANAEPPKPYVFPPTSLLTKPPKKAGDSGKYLQETAMKLQQTLKNFGVNVTITDISCGPAVTRYEIQPEQGVKVSKIVNLADDIKLNLAAADIRIEAPIPGKAAIGIEVPNKENLTVSFRELVESEEFQNSTSKISFCVGKDIGGNVKVADIAKMPHLLIAGATGSGKSVCINTIIMSILYKADPKDVKLIMVDPKVVELSVYNGIPHLLIPVVTDPKKAAGALNWAVAEMTDRYQKFADTGVRDLKGYNAKIAKMPDDGVNEKPEQLPQIVIIVDELADLMMVASGEVEEAICRLAQLARACGIHLIIATQRPSVNVITGLIKANMPSRIAFAVTSGIDSRTILDMNGAEKLLGKGDMLFDPQGVPKPLRVQGAFVTDDEVSAVVEFIKGENSVTAYDAEVQEKMESIESGNVTVAIDGNGGGSDDGRDALFAEAARILIDKEKGSIGMLQRYFKIGFNRAARIMDQLEEAGVVGPEEGTKPRKVIMSADEFENFMEEN